MGRKRRARSPSPPKQSADTTQGGEEVSRRDAAAKNQLKISRPRPSTAAADGADSSAVHALHPASRSTTKPAAPASQVESDADLIPEPVPKKAKASKKAKTVQVLEAAPSVSGKPKKTKTMPAPEADAKKKKKAHVQPEKATPAATRLGKAEQLEKSGVVKEVATENGDASRKGKGRKVDKVALTANQNGGGDKGTEEKADEEDAEGGASVQARARSFEELQKLYPNLTAYVEKVQAEPPRPETLNTAFGFIGDEQAKGLESKIKALRTLEAQAQILDEDIRNNIINMAK